MTEQRWFTGDTFGMAIPADAAALTDGGTRFLTDAFRRYGALGAGGRVTAILESAECPGGSTGRKLCLSVEYTGAEKGLPKELFVKFSRDFDDIRRDRGRTQMDREVRLAVLARTGFPIPIPATMFADYHRESGSGILITERIPYGRPPVEPHHPKCMDYAVPEPVEHYRALLSAIARLGGAHRGGRLAGEFGTDFGYDPDLIGVAARTPVSQKRLRDNIIRYASFADRYPAVLPEAIRCLPFIRRMTDEVCVIAEAETSVLADLTATTAHLTLCHWNANIDNAWFWRDTHGKLHCGLLDWGCVGEMNIAMSLWGALSGAEPDLWDTELAALLAVFAAEFRDAGGPALDTGLLHRQLVSYAIVMGVRWLLDTPALIMAAVPELADISDRRDDRIAGNEQARSQLLMLTNFLRLWQQTDLGAIVGPTTAHL